MRAFVRRRAAVQHRPEDAVDAEDAPGAGECEAEERQRLQRPDPVPLAGHVERSERDVHLPEEAGDARETRQDAEEQSHAQCELDEEGLQAEEGEVRQDDVLEERRVPAERRVGDLLLDEALEPSVVDPGRLLKRHVEEEHTVGDPEQGERPAGQGRSKTERVR